MKKKKLFMWLLGTVILFTMVFTIQILISNPVSAEVGPPGPPDDPGYKRPSCESPSGTRGCGDRQLSACSFGSKVKC